jgi:hypothetical protein
MVIPLTTPKIICIPFSYVMRRTFENDFGSNFIITFDAKPCNTYENVCLADYEEANIGHHIPSRSDLWGKSQVR